jgi:hypothetical protein
VNGHVDIRVKARVTFGRRPCSSSPFCNWAHGRSSYRRAAPFCSRSSWTPPVHLASTVGLVGFPARALSSSCCSFAALGLRRLGSDVADGLISSTTYPAYRANIRTKIADVRLAAREGRSRSCRKCWRASRRSWKHRDAPKGNPVFAAPQWCVRPVTGFGLRMARARRRAAEHGGVSSRSMVIFMLLDAAILRDRLIGLIGHGQLATTTKALTRPKSRQPAAVDAILCESLLYGIAVLRRTLLPPRSRTLVWADSVRRFDSSRTSVRLCGRARDPRQSRGPGRGGRGQ